MGSLKNHILISMPHMGDSFFGKSVIFICEHDTSGAMGLIINKPFKESNLNNIFEKLYVDDDSLLSLSEEIYFGGPVLIERGIILHTTDYKSEGTVRISDEFAITSQKTILKELQNQSISQYKLILGHAGWSSGQLEREIENGDWLLQSTTQDFVFKVPADQMWPQDVGSIGVDLDPVSGIGGQA